MALYRVHVGGIYSNKKSFDVDKILFFCERQLPAYSFLLTNNDFKKRLSNASIKSIKATIYNLHNKYRVAALQKEFYNQIKYSARYQLKHLNMMSSFSEFCSVLLSYLFPKYHSQRVKTKVM